MADKVGEYRIRWARVTSCVGTWHARQRMCIAEKRILFLWFIPMWMPLEHGNWRDDEDQARCDIAADIEFCMPLPPTKKEIT